MALYRLFRLDDDGRLSGGFDVQAGCDGEALGCALLQTENGARYILRQDERRIAEIEVNDNRWLLVGDRRGPAPRSISTGFLGLLLI